MNKGHWIFEQDFDIEDWFGFVYRIIELSTEREYIGKKQFFNYSKRIVKDGMNRKIVKKESDWKSYTGSSNSLNSAILENGKENYRFVMESLHKTKESLHHSEVNAQFIEDVLETKLTDGKTRKYYNKHISGVKFLPPEEVSVETRTKIKTTLIEKYTKVSHWRAQLTESEMKLLTDQYYTGNNHYLYRLMTEEERDEFVLENFVGENNPMFGKIHPNRGKTYFEIHNEESPLTGLSYEERYGSDRSYMIKELQKLNRKSVEGTNNPFYGQTHSKEQKEKWKEDERRIKRGSENGMFGKSVADFMTEEETESWRLNISKSTKGVPKKKSKCVHCGKECAPNMLARYHNDNCKNKNLNSDQER
jgi:hypothetical protein